MLKFVRIKKPEHYGLVLGMELRTEDLEELRAGTGIQDQRQALQLCLESSAEWTEATIDADGDTIMVHGLSASANGVGVPWMMASPKVYRHKKVLLRYSRKIIADMFKKFHVLANYVDSRNVAHIRWLEYMGFQFPDMVTQVNGVDFKYFYKERANV